MNIKVNRKNNESFFLWRIKPDKKRLEIDRKKKRKGINERRKKWGGNEEIVKNEKKKGRKSKTLDSEIKVRKAMEKKNKIKKRQNGLIRKNFGKTKLWIQKSKSKQIKRK